MGLYEKDAIMAGKHIRFDWAIKRLLRNKANFEVLEGFLSELLKFDVKIEEILESESNQTNPNDKYNRVDILVKDVHGDYMLIEVQNDNQDDYFLRMLYGQAKLISEHLERGDAYKKLTRVYSINIVYFPLGMGKDYIYVSDGSFRGMHQHDELVLNEDQKKAYGVQEVRELFTQYYIIKVNEFDDNARDTLDEWIYFLKHNEIKREFTAKGLERAKEVLRVDDMTRDEKIAYDIYVKNERIRISEIETAFRRGKYSAERKWSGKLAELERREQEAEQREQEAELQRKQAEQERIAAEQKVLALANMLIKAGVPIVAIAEQTGLSEEEIRRLDA